MRQTAVSVGILVGLLVVVGVAFGGVVAAEDETDAETNASFGAEVSSFMQASSEEAESSVDDGMFGAAMNRTDDLEERRQLIEQRQQRLEQRQERLAEQRGTIDSDEKSVRDRALAARVNVGAVGLERSVNGTERAAEQAGLDTDRLKEIRMNARELRGPEVAELARGLAGGPPADERGPPEDIPGVDQTDTGPEAGSDDDSPATPDGDIESDDHIESDDDGDLEDDSP